MKLVAGNSNRPLAEAIAAYLNIPLAKAQVRRFADMEVFVEIQENVRGEDVFIIQSTSFPTNDHLMELLIITDALRRSSAKRITAVVPYFGYARQDRRFPVEIILLCVRWYCKYGISYRDLAEMMQERGVNVDPSTIFRWVQRYAPEIEKRVRRYQGSRSGSWRVDETYVRVGGKWKYLFRAVDKHGQLIDFMLSDRRNTRAAYRFLRKALKTVSDHPPSSITADKLASYPKAIQRLQKESLLSKDVEHRTSKYLNNIIEADHGALKRVIRPTRGFQRMKTASATLKGFEVMRMIRRGHCGLAQRGVTGEIRLVNQLFGLAS